MTIEIDIVELIEQVDEFSIDLQLKSYMALLKAIAATADRLEIAHEYMTTEEKRIWEVLRGFIQINSPEINKRIKDK